jgi:hypothetical protein
MGARVARFNVQRVCVRPLGLSLRRLYADAFASTGLWGGLQMASRVEDLNSPQRLRQTARAYPSDEPKGSGRSPQSTASSISTASNGSTRTRSRA